MIPTIDNVHSDRVALAQRGAARELARVLHPGLPDLDAAKELLALPLGDLGPGPWPRLAHPVEDNVVEVPEHGHPLDALAAVDDTPELQGAPLLDDDVPVLAQDLCSSL